MCTWHCCIPRCLYVIRGAGFLADGVLYLMDVVHTLAAFINSFPPAASLLLLSEGMLLAELAALVSGLLPQLHAGCAAAAAQLQRDACTAWLLQRLQRLRQDALHLGHMLLTNAYLIEGCATAAKSRVGHGNGAALADGKTYAGSSRVGARFGSAQGNWQALLPSTPAARADALLAAVAAAGEHEPLPPTTSSGGEAAQGFLRALNTAHRLDAAVLSALERVRARNQFS